MGRFVTGCSESKEVVYFYAACQVHPVTCLDMCGLCPLSVCICVLCPLSVCVCVLCPLSVYHPGGHKSHDDPDGTHHNNGADPRYIPELNRPSGTQKRQGADIIRTPATPCEL